MPTPTPTTSPKPVEPAPGPCLAPGWATIAVAAIDRHRMKLCTYSRDVREVLQIVRPPAAVRAAHAWPRPRVIGWANGNRRGLDPFRGSRCFQTSLSQREGSPRSGVSFRFKVRGGFRPASCGKRGHRPERVSIRFEVRGGFRLDAEQCVEQSNAGFNPL